jgi:hypothetical protein
MRKLLLIFLTGLCFCKKEEKKSPEPEPAPEPSRYKIMANMRVPYYGYTTDRDTSYFSIIIDGAVIAKEKMCNNCTETSSYDNKNIDPENIIDVGQKLEVTSRLIFYGSNAEKNVLHRMYSLKLLNVSSGVILPVFSTNTVVAGITRSYPGADTLGVSAVTWSFVVPQ